MHSLWQRPVSGVIRLRRGTREGIIRPSLWRLMAFRTTSSVESVASDRGQAKVTTKIHEYSLLQVFIGLFRLPWAGITLLFLAAMLLVVVLAAYFKGYFDNGIDWSFWRLGLQPAIIVYILVIVPLTHRFWERALQSLRILMPDPDLTRRIARFNRRGEWIALSAGAVFPVVMIQPWKEAVQWSDLYGLVMSIVMFALLGLLIYGAIADTTRLARLCRHELQLDVFDTELLVPVARWGLSLSAAFVGGTTLSLVFQPVQNLRSLSSLIIYSVLVGATLLIFFISVWSVHEAMAAAKKRELDTARKNLRNARRELRTQASHSSTEATDRLYSSVAVWGIYERQVLETSTWPFNAGIVRRLLASTMTPIIVYFIKIVAGPGFRL